MPGVVQQGPKECYVPSFVRKLIVLYLSWGDRVLSNVSLLGTIPAGIGNLSSLVTLWVEKNLIPTKSVLEVRFFWEVGLEKLGVQSEEIITIQFLEWVSQGVCTSGRELIVLAQFCADQWQTIQTWLAPFQWKWKTCTACLICEFRVHDTLLINRLNFIWCGNVDFSAGACSQQPACGRWQACCVVQFDLICYRWIFMSGIYMEMVSQEKFPSGT